METRLIQIQIALLLLFMGLYFFVGSENKVVTNLEKEADRLLFGDVDFSLVYGLEIEGGEHNLTFVRDKDQNRWFLVSQFKSPVKKGLIMDTLFEFLRTLKKGYLRSKNPKDFAKLGIGTDETIKILLKDKKMGVIKSIWIGAFNKKDKTYFIKVGSREEVREIPSPKPELQRKYAFLFDNERLAIPLDRQKWIEKRVYPESMKIVEVRIRFGKESVRLVRKERKLKKSKDKKKKPFLEPTRQEKEAGIHKEDKYYWVVQRTKLVRINPIMVREQIVSEHLAWQGKVLNILQKIKNLEATDLAEPMKLGKKEASLNPRELMKYNFQKPEVTIMFRTEKDKKDAIYFSKKGDNVYFYAQSALEKENLIPGEKADYIVVYRWDRERSSELKEFQKTYKELRYWDSKEELLPGFEAARVQEIHLIHNQNKKKLEFARKGNIWLLKQPKKIPLDPEKIDKLLDNLENLKLGEWKGEWKEKKDSEEMGFKNGFTLELKIKKGISYSFHIGKRMGGFAMVHLPFHPKYKDEIFRVPAGFDLNDQASFWYDSRIFRYSNLHKIKKMVFEFPRKIVYILPKKRKKGSDPTPREKASGIKKDDERYYLIQEYNRSTPYGSYNTEELSFKEYIAKKSAVYSFESTLKSLYATKFIKVFFGAPKDRDFQETGLDKYALRIRILQDRVAGEDSYDFGQKKKHYYVFVSNRLPYARILETSKRAYEILTQFPEKAKPEKKYIQEKKPLHWKKKDAPKKEKTKKKNPRKKAPKKKKPKKEKPEQKKNNK